MAPQMMEDAPPHLAYAQVQNNQDLYLVAFLAACENNDAAVALQLAPDRDADELVKAGVKWDTFSVDYASSSPDAVKWLVGSGYDVNISLVAGSVLLPVVRHNNEASIRYLLDRGANPKLGPPWNAPAPMAQTRPIPNCGWTLNYAAAFCTPEIFALLLAHGADITNAIPLHHAAGIGPFRHDPPISSRVSMLKYLVGLGIDINTLDDAHNPSEDFSRRQGTPLVYAVRWAHVEETKWLLANGADPDKKSTHGISARDEATMLPLNHELAVLLRDYRGTLSD